jgi:hypothetical protein
MIACNLVFIKIPWTNAQMQGFVRLFLSRTFLEARTLASESQLYNFLELVVVSSFAAYLDNSFHITTFSADKSPCNLKFFIIIYLNIKPTCVFNIFIRHLWCLLGLCLISLMILVLVDILVRELRHVLVLSGHGCAWALVLVIIRLTSVVKGRLLYSTFLIRYLLPLALSRTLVVIYPLNLEIGIVLG